MSKAHVHTSYNSFRFRNWKKFYD